MCASKKQNIAMVIVSIVCSTTALLVGLANHPGVLNSIIGCMRIIIWLLKHVKQMWGEWASAMQGFLYFGYCFGLCKSGREKMFEMKLIYNFCSLSEMWVVHILSAYEDYGLQKSVGQNKMGYGGSSIVSILFIYSLIALFVWFITWSFRFCKKTAKAKGLPESYKWFGFLSLIGVIILVLAPPAKDVVVDTDDKNINGGSAAEELYKFKKLYDQGIITKEEFLTKKEELLKR